MALVVLPCGLHPLGLGDTTIPSALEPPPVIAAPAIDPITKDLQNVLTGRDPIDDQVVVALTIFRASGAAVMTTGQRLFDVRKITENTMALLESEARASLQRLVGNGDISLEKVTVIVDAAGQWADVEVHYFNLRSLSQRFRKLQIRVEAIQ